MVNSFSAATKFSHHLVACNVYVSAGKQHHAALLLRLLEEAQDHCTRLLQKQQFQQKKQKSFKDNNIMDQEKVVIVHAYADGPYDRSSYHLAGHPTYVATVAAQLATDATKALMKLEQQQQQQQQQKTIGGKTDSGSTSSTTTPTRHPTVGLVDHIAVMRLPPSTAAIQCDNNDTPEQTFAVEEIQKLGLLPSFLTETIQHQHQEEPVVPLPTTVASGWVARSIGHAMQQQVGTQVLFYGHAHPKGTPLATIRRESTRFFQSSDDSGDDKMPQQQQPHQATVGAPSNFVENYNIRLSSRCSHAQAKTLTKWVRGRDGGLPGVEALTLAYSNQRWEVACNMLQPHVAGAAEISKRVQEWELQQANLNFGGSSSSEEGLVEIGYRVGTTVEQCWTALNEAGTIGNDAKRDAYNQGVRERFQGFLSGSPSN